MGNRCSPCFRERENDASIAKRPRHSRSENLSLDVQPFESAVCAENEVSKFFAEESASASIFVRNDCVDAINFAKWQGRARALLDRIPFNEKHEAALARGSDALRAEAFESFGDQSRAQVEEFHRIHVQDAVRAFSEERRRNSFQQLLNMVHWNLKDYHQGGGFICAFLAIFLSADDICRVMWYLNEKQMQRYFKGEAIGFVSDAVVFHKLVQQKLPTLCAHMERLGINPEATQMYCSKWFTCMAVHFAPFSCVFQFTGMLLTHGINYLFQFGIAWLQHWETLLMTTTTPSEIVAMLRNEHPEAHQKWHPSLGASIEEQAKVFEEIIAKAVAVDLNSLNKLEGFAMMRVKEKAAYEELLAERKARAAALEAENSDIEFSDEED